MIIVGNRRSSIEVASERVRASSAALIFAARIGVDHIRVEIACVDVATTRARDVFTGAIVLGGSGVIIAGILIHAARTWHLKGLGGVVNAIPRTHGDVHDGGVRIICASRWNHATSVEDDAVAVVDCGIRVVVDGVRVGATRNVDVAVIPWTRSEITHGNIQHVGVRIIIAGYRNGAPDNVTLSIVVDVQLTFARLPLLCVLAGAFISGVSIEVACCFVLATSDFICITDAVAVRVLRFDAAVAIANFTFTFSINA